MVGGLVVWVFDVRSSGFREQTRAQEFSGSWIIIKRAVNNICIISPNIKIFKEACTAVGTNNISVHHSFASLVPSLPNIIAVLT